jgi:SAM-dependent methyltransferase
MTSRIDGDFLKFNLYKVHRDWRFLPDDERQASKREFSAIIDELSTGNGLRTFSLVGTRADADLMIWQTSPDIEAFAEAATRIASSSLGRYLERAYQVEMAAMEDETFHRLLESAQYGAGSARRMIDHCVAVLSALLSLLAAATVLSVLHPLLLPMLLVMVLPSAWAALTMARRRYRSFHRWVQHSRGASMLANLMIDTNAAPEVRVHGVGPYILKHFRGMSASQENEQARLARLAARTGLIASACTGAAALSTYLLLGALLWSGVMAFAEPGESVPAMLARHARDASAQSRVDVALHGVLNVEASNDYGDRAKFFAEVARVLKPGGIFLFADSVRKGQAEALERDLKAAGFDAALEDITGNVTEASRLDTPRRLELIRRQAPLAGRLLFRRELENYAAVEGSKKYRSFEDGGRTYLMSAAVKT